MAHGVISMGRPKKGEKKALQTSLGPDGRVAIIHLKGSPEYAAWLEAANQQTHIPKAAIFRLALEMWAKANGLEPPPEM